MVVGDRRIRQVLLGVLIAVGMVLMHGLVGLDGAGCADETAGVVAAAGFTVSAAADVVVAGPAAPVGANGDPESPGPCSDCLNHVLSACVAVLAALLLMGAAVPHSLVVPAAVAVVLVSAVVVTAARPPRTHAVHLARLCVSRT